MQSVAIRVLLVEDEGAHAEAVRRALEASDQQFELRAVRTLREYYIEAGSLAPDIALVDLNLPDGRGTEILSNQGPAGKFPIVIISAYGDQKAAVEALKSGAIDYVVKSAETLAGIPLVLERALRAWRLTEEHRRGEEALRKSEARFRGMAEQLLDVLYTTDAQGTITYLSPSAEHVFGRSLEAMIGHRFPEFLPEEEISRALEEFHKAVVGAERQRPLLLKMKRGDGSLFPGELNGSTVMESGTCVGMIGLIRDVTERMQAEQELLNERNRAQQYLDVAGVVLLSLSLDQKVTLINRKGCDLLGYSQNEILGQNWFDKCAPVRDRDRLKTWFAEVTSGGVDALEATEDLIVTKEGEEREVRWQNALLRDATGRITGMLSSGEDITEHKRLEEQLRQAQKMESIGRLAGGVAHDFNNLLTVINGYSDLALTRLGTDSPLHKEVSAIRKAGERAASLTRQLLAFSRKQVLEPRVSDINILVAESESMLLRLLEANIRFVTLLAPALWLVRIDPGQFTQVLLNLAVNARDAMPQGGDLRFETANAYVGEAEAAAMGGDLIPGQYVLLSVSDSGAGMDEEVKKHLFEPFFTTKGPGSGTGLGLAMIYGIVKQSGGHILVESERGVGTRFRIYLPRVVAEFTTETRWSVSTEGSTPSKTVLLIEDQASVRMFANKLLQDLGYRVLEAGDGMQALELSASHKGHIDILLSDVVLPGMRGREVALQLRRQRPDMKLLFMSGYASEVLDGTGVLEPGVSYLQKPFTRNDLAKKLDLLLKTSS